MPRFTAYGITLYSNTHLPGLLQPPQCSVGSSEVRVWMGFTPNWLHDIKGSERQAWYVSDAQEKDKPLLQVCKINQGEHFHFQYSDATEFVCDRQGTEIWATWPNNLTLEDTTTYLLGPILGFVLRLRGTTCLHASAVAIKDRIAVFVGHAGSGKSTLAAAFAQQGYAVLSDDVVALIDQDDSFQVQPAYPRIRLWQKSVAALYGKPDALPRIVPTHPTWDKYYLDLTQDSYQFQPTSLPLSAIYLLGDRNRELSAPFINIMPAREQLMSLVTNTYTNYLLDTTQRAQEFDVLSRVVKNLPIRQIIPHADLAYLPQLVDTILIDFHHVKNVITSIV